MAVYKVDIQTKYSGQFLTNSYHVSVPTLQDALEAGEDIIPLHRALLPPYMIIDRVRASTIAPNDNTFLVKSFNLAGTRPGTDTPLPPFVRFRVDLYIGPRRPLRKYLLQPRVGDVGGDSMTPAATALVNTSYVDPLIAMGVVCNEAGIVAVGGTLAATVGMHQLRRGSKRRATPVI